MKLVGASGQITRHPMYDASGGITTGGAPQLILPERPMCSMFIVQNTSDTAMYLEIGSARATATIAAGVVTSVAVTNAGFGFTVPPIIEFLGGGSSIKNPNYLAAGQPGFEGPSNVARARCVLGSGGSAGTVASIVVDHGGSGYVNAPYVFIRNSESDPFGCATPSATSGIALGANGGSYYVNGTATTTDAMAIFCATTAKRFICKWHE